MHARETAVGFYEKLGFTVIKEEDIDIGNGFFMNDYFMTEQKKPAVQFHPIRI